MHTHEPGLSPVTIGTAGHIDHGKSALVRALTGTDPDRLAEEQRRGMTLDLGFAHLDLPSGRRLGIVDVPGHEALVHNMLAGAGGLDLVMLVVAADEGAMPQTREHVDILRFLRLAGGVVVLNKIDLVADREWLDAVEDDLRTLVAGTVLEGAPVVRVSARTGEGMDGLVIALDRLSAGVSPRPADGPVRLPVDRSFTMQGFGTVVTGTLWSGTLRQADLVTLLPSGRDLRVRGLQVHGEPVREARAGSRVAVNLAGVEKQEITRGDVLAAPGAFSPTSRLDVRLRLLPSAPALPHGSRVHVHLGAGVTVGRVALVGAGRLGPGDETLAQLRLDRPVVAVHGDRLVIRRYSPVQTVGGGVVLGVSPPGRRRRQAEATLQAVAQSGPEALVVAAVATRGRAGLPRHQLAVAAGLESPLADQALATVIENGFLVEIGDRLFAQTVIVDLRGAIGAALQAYHAQAPWRRGMPADELKSRALAGGADRLFEHVLGEMVSSGSVVDRRGLLAQATHTQGLSDGDARLREALLAVLEQAGASPPPLDELRRRGPPEAVERMLQVLVDDGLVLPVAPDLRVATSAVEQVRQIVVGMVQAGAEVTVGSLRDRLQTSRRYALALLEYLDAIRVTRRAGDRRVLGPRAGQAVGASSAPGGSHAGAGSPG